MALSDQERLTTFVLSKRFGYGEALAMEKTPDCYLCDVAEQICCSVPIETGIMTYMEKHNTTFEDKGQQKLLMHNYRVLLKRAVTTDNPFLEKMLRFWSNHFSVENRHDGGYYMNEAILPYVSGSFTQMLSSAIRHPVMTKYLDNRVNYGDNSEMAIKKKGRNLGLNENLGRELLELHTVGPDAYGHEDIVETAKILSGIAEDFESGDPVTGFKFYPDRHEPGTKVVMGKTYVEGMDGFEAFIQDLALHESTANRIIIKLLTFMNIPYDTNDIASLVQVYQENNTELAPLYRAIMLLPRVGEYDMATATVMRPYEASIAATRHMMAINGEYEDDVEGYNVLEWAVNSLGRRPAMNATPDGYPTDPVAVAESTELLTRYSIMSRVTQKYINKDKRNNFRESVQSVPIPGMAPETLDRIDGIEALRGPSKYAMLYMTSEFLTF